MPPRHSKDRSSSESEGEEEKTTRKKKTFIKKEKELSMPQQIRSLTESVECIREDVKFLRQEVESMRLTLLSAIIASSATPRGPIEEKSEESAKLVGQLSVLTGAIEDALKKQPLGEKDSKDGQGRD